MAEMTPKQKRFADEYLIDLNATQAAKRAGYSEKTANEQGARLLAKASVKSYIAERMAEKEQKLIADQDEVLKYLTAVMRGETRAAVVVVENIGDYTSKARTINKAPDEKERLKAAELLGKRYGLYTDRLEAEVDMELNISIDYGDEE